MKLLLDTHTFIWFSEGDKALSKTAHSLLADTGNELYLSLVSVWEIQIKSQLGKLTLNSSLPQTITAQQSNNGIQLLPIELNHILNLSNLPHIHRDPFDRLLIAQAQVESMILLTRDINIQQYNVNTLW